MNIVPITLDMINEFFMNDKRVAFLGLPDQSLDYLYHKGTVIIAPHTDLLGIYDNNNKLMTVVEINKWNDVCGVINLNLSTDLHHTGTFRQVAQNMRQYLIEHTTYKTLLMYVPTSCPQVTNVAEVLGWKHECTIDNCLIWRLKEVGMIIYSTYLNREKNGCTNK